MARRKGWGALADGAAARPRRRSRFGTQGLPAGIGAMERGGVLAVALGQGAIRLLPVRPCLDKPRKAVKSSRTGNAVKPWGVE